MIYSFLSFLNACVINAKFTKSEALDDARRSQVSGICLDFFQQASERRFKGYCHIVGRRVVVAGMHNINLLPSKVIAKMYLDVIPNTLTPGGVVSLPEWNS